MENFWLDLKAPFFALAPMEDVTDTVFREVVMSVSTPGMLHVLFAEFTSTDGLCHPIGRPRVAHRLHINSSERELMRSMGIKIVAQIWGSDPENFNKAAKMIREEYDFDGIDINMGCPVKKIVKQASCSELIKFPDLAKEIVLATKEASNIPVSVKTRTGIKTHITEEWISTLLETKPAAITLHGRTQKMMSDYPAVWEEIGKAVKVRDAVDPNVVMLGNGDLASIEDCMNKYAEFKPEGFMVGRGIFHDPWFFNSEKRVRSREEKLELLVKHLNLYVDTWGESKGFGIMKKFFKIYTSEFYGASELRGKLMECKNREEAEEVINSSTMLEPEISR